jgi:membrane protease YdiL (CAAX protease family)
MLSEQSLRQFLTPKPLEISFVIDTHHLLNTPAAKIAASLFAIALIVIVVRRRTGDPRAAFAMYAPPPLIFAGWIILYAAWMLGTNAIMHWRGPWDFTVWQNDSLIHDAARILAVGILGPIAEELIFRGVLFTKLLQTKLGLVGTVLLTSVGWACLHFDYSWQVIAMFVICGILLGLARHTSRSLWTPIAMHILWNLYAVW